MVFGTKRENAKLLQEMVDESIQEHAKFRENHYGRKDGKYITDEIKNSIGYREGVKSMREAAKELRERLHGSVPFFSERYQAHMDWDTVLPGNVGYLTALLYNQNNVATEGGPATSRLEKEAGQDLCRLLGYAQKENQDKESWGHITADGSIANLEAMWAARNLKFLPFAVVSAIQAHKSRLASADSLKVSVYQDGKKISKRLLDCSEWELFNINPDETAELPDSIIEMCGLKNNELDKYLAPYLLQNVGLAWYSSRYPLTSRIQVIVPATRHYSWPKAGTILGIGQDHVVGIPVDDQCRMDTKKLKATLKKCIKNQEPVMMLTAVIGSTEEGVVDNLEEILKIREQMEKRGLQFHLHCDAAWGGYLKTIMMKPDGNSVQKNMKGRDPFVLPLPLSSYAQKQYDCLQYADTITI